MRTMKMWIALTPVLLSAAKMPPPSPPKQETQDAVCRSPFHVMHADVRHTESKGVGYDDGYTTLEWFGMYQNYPNFMPFLDVRGHVFNDGKLAGNVGLGGRTAISSINHIFGLYLYYDVRQNEHDLTANQLSPGLELLGKRMEYRINAYFPVAKHTSRRYQHRFRRFDGNRIIEQYKRKYVMTGVDAEVGSHITQTTRHDFYIGLSPYYFTSDASTAWGGKGRVYWRYKEYVSLEASYAYDHVFKNIVQGTVAFSYPFGSKLKRQGKNCPNPQDLALSRAAFAPYRFEIPVVQSKKHHRIATNPNTRQPWRVWFVNNTSSSDGTIESPFPTLLQAQNASGPNDMIYVFSGDGTNRGMNAGITLKNGQLLFGAGTIQTVRTTKGKIHIPAMSPIAPNITNTAGNVITLANGNEISGMNISIADGRSGIVSSNVGVNSVSIHNNIFGAASPTAQTFGVNFTGFGNIRVRNNQFFGAPGSGLSVAGIFLFLTNPSQVRVSSNNIAGYDYGVFVRPQNINGNFASNVNIFGNNITGFNFSGILSQIGLPNSLFRIANNNIFNNVGVDATQGGIHVVLSNSNGAGTYVVENNNVATTTTLAGVSGILINTAGPTSTVSRIIVNNNNILAGPLAGSYGLNMNAGAGDTFCATITNNRVTLQNPTTNGMSLSGVTGVLNIDDLSNNIAQNVLLSGTVNLVAPNSCGQ